MRLECVLQRGVQLNQADVLALQAAIVRPNMAQAYLRVNAECTKLDTRLHHRHCRYHVRKTILLH